MGLDSKAAENIILKPIITVFGVGGAGGNAVNNMIRSNLPGTNFVVANTDAQALKYSESTKKIQLGTESTRGLGAGAYPEIGKKAAIESENEIREHLEGSNMVFITAGMGGGTGTGASAEIARIAQELGILTVGVVTKPFLFEGNKRMQLAEQGLIELQKYVDTLIIIPNQNLFRVANENTTFQDAFEMADAVLHSGVRSVTDLITCPGVVNLDFADIETIMNEKGKAMMGTGEDSGENRAIKAAESAISNPLLDQNSMCGAKGVLINITGGKDMTLYEVDSAANRIKEEVGDSNTNIIFGSTFNVELEGTIRVSVIATGIGQYNIHHPDQDSEKTEAKTESGKIKSDSIAIDSYEPPSYDEYKNKITIKESEIELKSRLRQLHNHQIDWQQSKKLDEIKRVIASEQKLDRRPKSLLQRMWSSLTIQNATHQPNENFNNYHDKISPVTHEDVSKIQDIPYFIRKDREK